MTRTAELRVRIAAPVDDVFDALTTTDGLSGWWTTLVSGSSSRGGQLRFEFEGVAETITMRVDEAIRPRRLTWHCLGHSGQAEWAGTRLMFDLEDCEAETELSLQHEGIAPELVEPGWQHFLRSLTAHVEHGQGMPFGSDDGMP